MKAECILDSGAVLAEGPVWHDGRLWWVDIERREIHALDVATGRDRRWVLPSRVGFVVPRVRGGFLVGTEQGLAAWRPHGDDKLRDDPGDEGQGLLEPFAHPERDRPGNRFNDAKCDPQGRLWAGTMAIDETPGRGALYRVDGSGITRMLEGISISNGLAWSPDGATLYYIDSPTRRVDAFDFHGGEISRRRTVVTLEDGFPDGMCSDADGNLWIALWGGRCVACHDPRTGRRVDQVEVPAEAVTSCCFGEGGTLFITTASRDLDSAGLLRQPLAGGIFRVQTQTTGVPIASYAADLSPRSE